MAKPFVDGRDRPRCRQARDQGGIGQSHTNRRPPSIAIGLFVDEEFRDDQRSKRRQARDLRTEHDVGGYEQSCRGHRADRLACEVEPCSRNLRCGGEAPEQAEPAKQKRHGQQRAVYPEIRGAQPGELGADDCAIGHRTPGNHHLAEKPEQHGVDRSKPDTLQDRRNGHLTDAEAGCRLGERPDEKAGRVQPLASLRGGNGYEIAGGVVSGRHLAEKQSAENDRAHEQREPSAARHGADRFRPFEVKGGCHHRYRQRGGEANKPGCRRRSTSRRDDRCSRHMNPTMLEQA